MKISVQADITAFRPLRSQIETEQLPYATMLALNATALHVHDDQVKEMRDVFDRPTPYTLSSLRIRHAKKKELIAYVEPKNFASKAVAADKFLAPSIEGGQRSMKRFEKALQAIGAMPADHRAVPATGAKMDAYGNMDRGQIVQILSFFQAFPEAGYKANMSQKRRASLERGSKSKQGFAYFVGQPPGSATLGIWQRFKFAGGSAIKPILIFVPSSQYQKIFDFKYVADQAIKRHFVPELEKALVKAVATATPQ